MAKNYSIAEAVQIIAENEDITSVTDIGKRYPLLANIITRVATVAGEDFVLFASFLPEHVSANKVNKAIKDFYDGAEDADDEDADAEEADDDEEEEAEEEEPKKPAKKAGRPKKAAKVEEEEESDEESDSDYDNMSNKELWALLGEVKGRKKCREEFGDTKTADMVKFFKKYYPNGVDAEQPEEVEEAKEETTDAYAGKSAVELYKMCKTRKIKAEQKKPAKYYAELLKKADAEAAAAEEEAEDEEWDEEEEEKPAKKPEKKGKKAAKKAEPEPEEDDDDDDWEI